MNEKTICLAFEVYDPATDTHTFKTFGEPGPNIVGPSLQAWKTRVLKSLEEHSQDEDGPRRPGYKAAHSLEVLHMDLDWFEKCHLGVDPLNFFPRAPGEGGDLDAGAGAECYFESARDLAERLGTSVVGLRQKISQSVGKDSFWYKGLLLQTFSSKDFRRREDNACTVGRPAWNSSNRRRGFSSDVTRLGFPATDATKYDPTQADAFKSLKAQGMYCPCPRDYRYKYCGGMTPDQQKITQITSTLRVPSLDPKGRDKSEGLATAARLYHLHRLDFEEDYNDPSVLGKGDGRRLASYVNQIMEEI